MIDATSARIYFAAPIPTYWTRRYDRLFRRARQHFPEGELISARSEWRSPADWRLRWPVVCATLTAFCFIAEQDGWIGRGVWCELRDAEDRGVSVSYLTDLGALFPLDAIELSTANPNDWQRYIRVKVRAPVKARYEV